MHQNAAEKELRRPRGESRRLGMAAADPVAPSAESGGRRYSTALRYGPTATGVRPDATTGGPVPGDAPPVASGRRETLPVAVSAHDAAKPRGAGDYPARVHRRSLGLSHKIAAVAAVSGLALAAAYPNLGGEAAEEQRVAQSTPAVSDVSVPASDEYDVSRSTLTSSHTKDDELDYLMSASGGDVTKVDTGGVLAQPLDSIRITSKFGTRVDPVSGVGIVTHIGQDYGAKCGTPVKAAASGKVVQAAWAGHSGNRVRIDHGNGLETTYNHNTSLTVAVGQKVERGDVVAASGTTGNSTGCHLHFEVLVDGDAVDPAGWL